MLTLPRLSRFMDFDDDDILMFPSSILWPEVRQSNGCGKKTTVPTTDNTKFNLNLNMAHFDPSEISVKMDDGTLHVSGKHEKSQNGVYEYREFVQKRSVPDNVLADQMKCKLNQRGYLQIEAPLKQPEQPENKDSERTIPIEFSKNSQITNTKP